MSAANLEHADFAVAISTSPFISVSQFGAFIFFGAVTTVGVLWVYFLVPETKVKHPIPPFPTSMFSCMCRTLARDRRAKVSHAATPADI